MADIPQDLIDKVMVKCARRCCICRRFRPTKLQVHHIVLQSDGGTNDEDNLIVICTSCHTDVHSIVPFTRRFSVNELKGHRDALVQMLTERKLPTDELDNTDTLIDSIIGKISTDRRISEAGLLSPEAIELLLAAANGTGDRQGLISLSEKHGGTTICPGNHECLYKIGDKRSYAKYKVALEELENMDLIEKISNAIYEVTHLGYLLSDEIASSHDLPSP